MKSSVTWLMRHPRANTNHSIERCFEAIDGGMQTVASPTMQPVVHVVPRPTSGLFSMLQNCWAALQIQADIAHITGDIHYVLPFVQAKHRVLTVHDVGHVQDPAHSKLKRWLLLFIWFKWPLRHCDTVSVYRKKHENASVNWSRPFQAKSDWSSPPPSGVSRWKRPMHTASPPIRRLSCKWAQPPTKT